MRIFRSVTTTRFADVPTGDVFVYENVSYIKTISKQVGDCYYNTVKLYLGQHNFFSDEVMVQHYPDAILYLSPPKES